MTTFTPGGLPGVIYLIDTSALARVSNKAVADVVAGLIEDNIAATCATVDLEVGFSARGADSLRRVRQARRERYLLLETDERAAKRARNVQLMMAERGLHRAAGVIDLLTAAVAELNGAVLLHYDADFEHIASVTGQRQMWIVPRGSVD